MEVETIEYPHTPNSMDADGDDMEIDEEDSSPLLHEEELPNEREDKIDSLDEAFEDGDALGLFVDLGVLGLELDDDACKNIMEDEM